MKAVPIRRIIWWWSPMPYARERGLLWVTVTVGYRYYDDAGERVEFP